MRHTFAPRVLALSVSAAIAAITLPVTTQAANLNTAQLQEDLITTCYDSGTGYGGYGNETFEYNGITARAATFDPQSTLCSNFYNEYVNILELNGNDPQALAAAVSDLAAAITPDELPALYTSLVQLSTDQIRNVSHHLRNQRSRQQSDDDATASLDQYMGGNAGDALSFGRFSLFADASKVDGDQINTDYEVGYDLETDHYTLGLDYRITDNLVAGFAYGNSDTTLEYLGAQNQTDNTTDHYILYGSWYRDNFSADAVLGIASGEFDTRRQILGSTALGNTNSELTYFNVTGSYDFVAGGLSYGPHASIDLLEGEIDAFEESNGGGWEAAFASQDVTSQIFAMGGHLAYAASFGWGVLVPHARVEWRTELEDERDLIVGRFVQDPASSFTITADKPDSDWYQLSAGVSAQFAHGIAAFLDYEEVIEYDNTDLGIVTLGARWEM